jgi:DNA-binding NtrC family response regulator
MVAIPADAVSNSDAADPSRRPIATILVADDNRDMVDSVASLLRMANYNVICTYSAAEVLSVLDERADIELVLSDIRMPEYTGFDLYRVMRYRWPKVPIVLVTGFDIVESDAAPRGAVIVKKPFTLAQLDATIKAQLSISRPGAAPTPNV